MRTEDLSPRFTDLDAWSSLEAVHAIFEGQLSAVAAVRAVPPEIAAAADAAGPGSPTAGASSMPGHEHRANRRSDGASFRRRSNGQENESARHRRRRTGTLLQRRRGRGRSATQRSAGWMISRFGARDVVIGLAASGATPYTLEFVQGARNHWAWQSASPTIRHSDARDGRASDLDRHRAKGHLAGSTRIFAGASQLAILDPLVTPDDDPLRARLSRIDGGHAFPQRQAQAAGDRDDRASRALRRRNRENGRSSTTGGNVKLAVLVAKGIDVATAKALIGRSRGHLRSALARHEA